MMQQLRNPKNVKMVSLFIAAVFVLGCFALSLTQSGLGGSASAAATESAIGVVNVRMLISQSPDLAALDKTMREEIETAKKEFEEKAKDMSEQDKAAYYRQLEDKLVARQQELMQPVIEKAKASMKRVADKKGLLIVVDKNVVLFGGVDVTDDAAKLLRGSK